LKCLCFSALVAAQFIPLALCQKIFPADFALPEAKPPFIPNKEIHREFINAMSTGGWQAVIHVLKASEKLL